MTRKQFYGQLDAALALYKPLIMGELNRFKTKVSEEFSYYNIHFFPPWDVWSEVRYAREGRAIDKHEFLWTTEEKEGKNFVVEACFGVPLLEEGWELLEEEGTTIYGMENQRKIPFTRKRLKDVVRLYAYFSDGGLHRIEVARVGRWRHWTSVHGDGYSERMLKLWNLAGSPSLRQKLFGSLPGKYRSLALATETWEALLERVKHVISQSLTSEIVDSLTKKGLKNA